MSIELRISDLWSMVHIKFMFFTPMNVQKASIDHHWSHRRSLFIGNFHFCPCLKEPLFLDKDVLTRIAWARFQRFPWEGQ